MTFLDDNEPILFRTFDVPVVDGFATLPDGRVIASNAKVVRVPYLTAEDHDRLMAAMFPEPEPDFPEPEPDVDSLDAAWAEAEAALLKGQTLDLTLESHVDGGRYLAWTMRHTDTAIIRGEGLTPAAALRALAAALRETRR